MSVPHTELQAHVNPKTDRFTAKHVVMQLGFAIFLLFSDELDRIFNLYLLTVPLVLIPFGVVAVIFLHAVASGIYKKRWRVLASALAAPPIVATILSLLAHYQLNPDWLHFQLSSAEYKKAIAKDRHTSSGLRTWSWGSTGGAAVTNEFKKVVYDESDGIINDTKKSTPNMHVSVRSFGDHFYLVTTLYP